eukprot:CAMPEP_0170177298 /NCGR_PEP_ID=MMETSP0040_2-20121228/9976_1 /TAXON_ID=641309 /ORGANISM="Lotharella oceanica, Strain CCMP622" /LENGTH=183 /DNA_ID=CAMNT_0010419891 /DNA_START=1117 /DNA_END=1664 /DNA_ORIENTATION=+
MIPVLPLTVDGGGTIPRIVECVHAVGHVLLQRPSLGRSPDTCGRHVLPLIRRERRGRTHGIPLLLPADAHQRPAAAAAAAAASRARERRRGSVVFIASGSTVVGEEHRRELEEQQQHREGCEDEAPGGPPPRASHPVPGFPALLSLSVRYVFSTGVGTWTKGSGGAGEGSRALLLLLLLLLLP